MPNDESEDTAEPSLWEKAANYIKGKSSASQIKMLKGRQLNPQTEQDSDKAKEVEKSFKDVF